MRTGEGEKIGLKAETPASKQHVGSDQKVTYRMRHFNKWKPIEIYHLAVGGIFTLYVSCKCIKVHSPGVEEKWNKIVFVQNPRTCP